MTRGKAKVFTLASVALLSCRAVLGIEEIESTTDAGTCTMGCNVCCREPLKGSSALPELEKVAKQTGCLCGDAGVCATECSVICSGTGMPGPECIQCLDTAVISGAKPECGKSLMDCSANATCKPLGDCLKTCKN